MSRGADVRKHGSHFSGMEGRDGKRGPVVRSELLV